MSLIESAKFSERMKGAVSICWEMFSRKVGSGLILVNKEASMQLQYAYLLKQIIPLITIHKNESFEVELETGVKIGDGTREIDLMFRGSSGSEKYSIAIEMKCYKTLASSGKPRGATDIFMKDVYLDFYLLEQYINENHANEAIALVMNDMKRLVHPVKKDAKCWDYDTSHGTKFSAKEFDTPIGGKPVNFFLESSYELNWSKHGDFWFMAAQGVESNMV
ncbi:hypothetical protein [Moritella sp. Urea-trap-13]|uniref:hypothetical protein n=1 Tax=Moritella sp. Urea-trap-13 TaxID=2058327 RepID=UPI000C33FD08|nr:hypothetical protein [Moritella sp. Urea-trap-13]PKH06649.1 hypothetical protein CXF93_12180 [Moritella sp. Urea-trap-13]